MITHKIVKVDEKNHEFIDLFNIKTLLSDRECSIRFIYDSDKLDILDGDESAYGEYNLYSSEEVKQIWPMEIFWLNHFCNLYYGEKEIML